MKNHVPYIYSTSNLVFNTVKGITVIPEVALATAPIKTDFKGLGFFPFSSNFNFNAVMVEKQIAMPGTPLEMD